MQKYLPVCPSTRRSHNVPEILKWWPDMLFVVHDKADEVDYRIAGARLVVRQRDTKDMTGLPAARNTCMEIARDEGVYCLQVDDDLQELYVSAGGSNKKIPIAAETGSKETAFEFAADKIYEAMLVADVHLGALASNANVYFAKPRIHVWAFCCAHFIMVNPFQPEWWHPTIDYKDDWELTLRHLRAYQGIVRMDYIAPDALHWTNPGGLCDDPERLQKDVENSYLLCRMYPGMVRRNPKRVGELRMAQTVRDIPQAAKDRYNEVNRTFGFATRAR